MAEGIEAAIPFYWPNDLDDLLKPMPLPAHVIAPIKRPAELMWISFEGAHPNVHEESGSTLLTDAMFIAPIPGGLVVHLLGDFGLISQIVRWGQAYPTDVGSETTIERLLKFFAFLNSPFTMVETRRPDRPSRREAMRAGLSEEPVVHVVVLRQPLHVRESSGESDSRDIQWRHRWWVRGHFRAQWLPSQHGHRLTWIAPYVKGPEGKDFKAAVYAVVR